MNDESISHTIDNNEEWKHVPGLVNIYVSNKSRIAKRIDSKITTLYDKHIHNDYFYVYFDSKEFKVADLVARAWIDNPNDYPIVDHINEIKSDDSVTNLRWCTQSQNVTFAIGVAVIRIDVDGNEIEFSSISNAAESIQSNPSDIAQCCNGTRKTCKAFCFKYKLSKSEQRIQSKRKRSTDPVYMLDENKQIIKKFESLSSAEVETKVSKQSITKCCEESNRTAGGYNWQWVNPKIARIRREHADSGASATAVHQIDGNGHILATFTSVRSAAQAVKGLSPHIADCCRIQTHTCKGFHWRYVNPHHVTKQVRKIITSSRCRKVSKLNKNGEVEQQFNSLKEAQDNAKCSRNAMIRWCKIGVTYKYS